MLPSLLFIFCIGSKISQLQSDDLCDSASCASASASLTCLWPLGTVAFGTGGAHCSMDNINLTGKISSQSSNYTDSTTYTSNRAYDGNYCTCSNTNTETASWWEMDLQGVYNISCISIFNKCGGNTNISGARIYIGNSTENNGINNRLVKNITGFELCKSNVYTFEPTVGRYINVSISNGNPVILCEVNITGKKIDAFKQCQEPEGTVPDGAHCSMKNINLTRKISSQSSNHTHDSITYTSDRAYDGNYSTCSNTQQNTASFWKLDLQGVYNISCISIFNKGGHNTNISGARIYIGNSRRNNGTNNRLVKNITGFEVCKSNVYTFKPTVGRYITVLFPEEKPGFLCEVNITGKKKESPFILYNESMEWEEALYYCRQYHKNLASILDEEKQAFAELEAAKATTDYVWLGLHYTCTLQFWFWVDNNAVTFEHWNPNKAEDCDTSGAMENKLEYLWFTKSDYEKFNFICAL